MNVLPTDYQEQHILWRKSIRLPNSLSNDQFVRSITRAKNASLCALDHIHGSVR